MGSENLIPGRKRLIHPLGDSNWMMNRRNAGGGIRSNSIRIHKRPSYVWFRSFRDELSLTEEYFRSTQESQREFRRKFRRNLLLGLAGSHGQQLVESIANPSRPFSSETGLRRQVRSVDDVAEQVSWIDFERIGEVTEFQYIELPLAAFDLANERMRAAQPPRQFPLRNTGFLSCFDQRCHQRLVARCSELFAHVAPDSGATHIAALALAPIEGTGL